MNTNSISPTLAAQLLDPQDASLSAGSNTPVKWKCDTDPRHIWTASPNTRKRSPKCPVCLNKIIIAGVNDLLTTHPKVAAQLVDPGEAKSVHHGTHTELLWQCDASAQHQWPASVVSRTRLNAGCPYCSGRLPMPGVNDLATTHPNVTAQLVDPIDATSVGAGSAKKLLWQCPDVSAHTWKAAVRNRVGTARKAPTGCPDCIGRTNRLPTRHQSLEQANSPLLLEAVDPDLAGKLSLGSGKSVAWHCTECKVPHDYLMSVQKKIRGQGCPVKAGVQILAGVNDLATTHPDVAAQLIDPTLATSLSKGSMTFADWQCANGHQWSAPVYARVAGNGCPDCCPVGSSYGEQEMLAALLALDPATKHHAMIHNPDGRDIEIDALCGKLAVEFNGLFWHSEAGGRDRTSHARKTTAIEAAGLNPMTVWEDEWNDPAKRALVIRMMAHRTNRLSQLEHALDVAGVHEYFTPESIERIGARSLNATMITGAQASAFHSRNHIQGPVALAYNFALLDADEQIRAVIGLRSPMQGSRTKRAAGRWDIQRYATNGVIPGGFSKLLAFAEKELHAHGEQLDEWVSLSANESSTGQLYAATGFTIEAAVRPNYWYTAGPLLRGKRAPKEAFQLKRFKNDEVLVYQDGWTEREAAQANKMLRIWDAGKLRWVKTVI